VYERTSYWLLCLCPRKVGELTVDGHCLSVCLSVPCLILSREWKGIQETENWQEGSLWHGDPWPYSEVERSKVKVTRLL